MRHLSLDYVHQPVVWPGWLLLLAALAVAGVTGQSYWAAKRELSVVNAAAGGAPQRAQSKLTEKSTYPAPLRENLAYANGVVQNLALPWDMLFKTVEGTGNVPVALLAVQPDPQKRMVRISGEAKDYAAVLTYLARLDGSDTLRNVHLLSHQLKQDDPQHPLLFTIAASWTPEP